MGEKERVQQNFDGERCWKTCIWKTKKKIRWISERDR